MNCTLLSSNVNHTQKTLLLRIIFVHIRTQFLPLSIYIIIMSYLSVSYQIKQYKSTCIICLVNEFQRQLVLVGFAGLIWFYIFISYQYAIMLFWNQYIGTRICIRCVNCVTLFSTHEMIAVFFTLLMINLQKPKVGTPYTEIHI